MTPREALAIAQEMIRDRRVIPLEGGGMTTLTVRAQEQAIERRATQLAQPAGRDPGQLARTNALQEVAERIASRSHPTSNKHSRRSPAPSGSPS